MTATATQAIQRDFFNVVERDPCMVTSLVYCPMSKQVIIIWEG